MKKKLALALATVLACGLLFTGCSGGSGRVVNVCSWGEYIDTDLITQFEEETGITVNYQTADSNEILYSQLKNGGANYDVIVPSDYMIARLIEEDMLAELNYDNIPNYSKIDDAYKLSLIHISPSSWVLWQTSWASPVSFTPMLWPWPAAWAVVV